MRLPEQLSIFTVPASSFEGNGESAGSGVRPDTYPSIHSRCDTALW
jgi:hypothetical protein